MSNNDGRPIHEVYELAADQLQLVAGGAPLPNGGTTRPGNPTCDFECKWNNVKGFVARVRDEVASWF